MRVLFYEISKYSIFNYELSLYKINNIINFIFSCYEIAAVANYFSKQLLKLTFYNGEMTIGNTLNNHILRRIGEESIEPNFGTLGEH